MTRYRRRVLAACLGLLLLSGCGSPASPSPSPSALPGASINDIDGDGRVDVVYLNGTDSEDDDPETDDVWISRVVIVYASGRTQKFSRNEIGRSGRDGFSDLVVANLNGDAYADLVIGSEGHVLLAYGSAAGIDGSHVQDITLPEAGLTSLAVVPRPSPLVVVGNMGATVDGHEAAGAVTVFPVDAAGRAGEGVRLVQGSPGIPGAPGDQDDFGYAVAASGSTLVVGAPGETLDGRRVGSVTLLHRTGLTSFTGQAFDPASPGIDPSVQGQVSSFGNVVAIEDGYVAVHLSRWVPPRSMGAVQLFRYTADSATPDRGLADPATPQPVAAGSGGEYGSQLAFLRPCPGQHALAIAAPGHRDLTGEVTVLALDPNASCGTRTFGWTDIGVQPGPSTALGSLDPRATLRSSASLDVADTLLVGGYGLWETQYPFTGTVRDLLPTSAEGVSPADPMAT